MSKIALVTGASRGVGKAVCAHLALKGFDLVLAARSVTAGEVVAYPGTIIEAKALVESLGRRALAVRCDLGKREDITRLVQAAMECFGRIDLLVNNAKYEGRAHWGAFTETPWTEVEALMNINLLSTMYLAQLVVPIMRQQKQGTIVNLTSNAAVIQSPLRPGQGTASLFYGTSKAAVNRFTVGLAEEVKADNIAVINVLPGPTMTERGVAELPKYAVDTRGFQSVHVPATCIAALATATEPLLYTGHIIEAATFVKEHSLMQPEDFRPLFHSGSYEPYLEPYWLALAGRLSPLES